MWLTVFSVHCVVFTMIVLISFIYFFSLTPRNVLLWIIFSVYVFCLASENFLIILLFTFCFLLAWCEHVIFSLHCFCQFSCVWCLICLNAAFLVTLIFFKLNGKTTILKPILSQFSITVYFLIIRPVKHGSEFNTGSYLSLQQLFQRRFPILTLLMYIISVIQFFFYL